ncbi:MAG: twin-arginine translocation signal domain-containing protein, partial [Gemmatimonadetes bacterium]|nr:twin-arginine translocation signal domain-containing protein [Gemmatimonadota bacterium]MYH51596.1 twin-arginine translocation signal domain-containing protein [Gemmatimonadota bacterium]
MKRPSTRRTFLAAMAAGAASAPIALSGLRPGGASAPPLSPRTT